MSRIGKQPIIIPKEVEVKVNKDKVVIKGPKGELPLRLPQRIKICQQDKNTLALTVLKPKEARDRALWGTIQRLISNNIKGVTEGFSKKLNISGVGYRANIKGESLILEVGFSHPIEFSIPKNIKINVEGNNVITIWGIDKQQVGQVAAEIRAIRKPEPYKGKGIAYENEVIHRKPGKQATGSGGAGGG